MVKMGTAIYYLPVLSRSPRFNAAPTLTLECLHKSNLKPIRHGLWESSTQSTAVATSPRINIVTKLVKRGKKKMKKNQIVGPWRDILMAKWQRLNAFHAEGLLSDIGERWHFRTTTC